MHLFQIYECEWKFDKMKCRFEYEHVSTEKEVLVCSRKKEKKCDSMGPEVCSTEYDMGER